MRALYIPVDGQVQLVEVAQTADIERLIGYRVQNEPYIDDECLIWNGMRDAASLRPTNAMATHWAQWESKLSSEFRREYQADLPLEVAYVGDIVITGTKPSDHVPDHVVWALGLGDQLAHEDSQDIQARPDRVQKYVDSPDVGYGY